MNIKPITPEELEQEKEKLIPSYVITAFNKLIVKNWDYRASSFTQDAIIEEIIKEASSAGFLITRDFIFESHLLDIESIFKKVGWHVEYDKPAYCESYPARFRFTKGFPKCLP